MKIIIYKNSHGLSDFIKVLCLILVSTMDQGEVQYVIVWYNTIPIPSQQTEATKSDPFVGRLPEGYFFVILWDCGSVHLCDPKTLKKFFFASISLKTSGKTHEC